MKSNIESKSIAASAKHNYYTGQKNKPKTGNSFRTNFHSKSSISFFNPAQLEFDFSCDDSANVSDQNLCCALDAGLCSALVD